MEYRSCMKRNGTKRGKKKQLWANFRSGTGTETGRYRYHPAEANRYRYRYKRYRYRPSEPNRYGTDQSGTGIAVPKMPRFVCFCIVKLKFTHRLYRNLTK